MADHVPLSRAASSTSAPIVVVSTEKRHALPWKKGRKGRLAQKLPSVWGLFGRTVAAVTVVCVFDCIVVPLFIYSFLFQAQHSML